MKTTGTKAGVIVLVMMGLVGALLMSLAAPGAAAGQNVALSKGTDTYIVPLEGGDVMFTYYATNYIQFPLTSIDDDLLGEVGALGTCALPVNQTDYSCSVPATITPLNGDTSQHHESGATATFTGEGEETADAYPVRIDFAGITATKSASPTTLPTAGGEVEFTFGVSNPGSIGILVYSLVDDKLGDLDEMGDCLMPQFLDPGESYPCSVTWTVPAGEPGMPHVNTVTATGTPFFEEAVQPAGVNSANLEAEEFVATATASATVDYLATGITATKTADPASVPEAGGDVTFTYAVTNVGELGMIVDALADDKLGDLVGQGDCAAGQTIAAGATYTCAVTTNLSGTAGTPHVNTFTADATSVDTETLEENVANAAAAHQATAVATVTFIAPEPTTEPVPTSPPTVRLDPLLPSAEETPAIAPTPVPAAPAAEEVVSLAFTSTESSFPAALAFGSISAGALLLGWLRRREDRR